MILDAQEAPSKVTLGQLAGDLQAERGLTDRHFFPGDAVQHWRSLRPPPPFSVRMLAWRGADGTAPAARLRL